MTETRAQRDQLASEVLAAAREAGVTLATAESCTGGLIAGALTEIAGSSDVVDRGFVTYSNRAKTEMLGVLPQTLDAHGAVSEEVAREMAEGARLRGGVGMAVSVSGIAGPGGSEFKPEGRVCFGLSDASGSLSETVEFGAIGRTNVRAATVMHALRALSRQAAQRITGYRKSGSPRCQETATQLTTAKAILRAGAVKLLRTALESPHDTLHCLVENHANDRLQDGILEFEIHKKLDLAAPFGIAEFPPAFHVAEGAVEIFRIDLHIVGIQFDPRTEFFTEHFKGNDEIGEHQLMITHILA